MSLALYRGGPRQSTYAERKRQIGSGAKDAYVTLSFCRDKRVPAEPHFSALLARSAGVTFPSCGAKSGIWIGNGSLYFHFPPKSKRAIRFDRPVVQCLTSPKVPLSLVGRRWEEAGRNVSLGFFLCSQVGVGDSSMAILFERLLPSVRPASVRPRPSIPPFSS